MPIKASGEEPRKGIMKVSDPNLSSLAAAEAAKTQVAKAAAAGAGASRSSEPTGASNGDDVHLSELVRSLRTLAADSPERQAYVDKIAQVYAKGAYRVDTAATAGKIIDDALGYK
jgi:anti-sigma28 factor (negative regulator of flagellin synthesis)